MSGLSVTFVNRHCAYVSGYGSRAMLSSLRGGRAPVYATRVKAWVTTEETARNLLAVCQSRGIDVTISEEVA